MSKPSAIEVALGLEDAGGVSGPFATMDAARAASAEQVERWNKFVAMPPAEAAAWLDSIAGSEPCDIE